MWYGRLATTSYGGATRWTRSWSSASPSMRRERRRRPSKRSRRNAARPRSSSTAVTSAPDVEQAAGQQAEARPDLEDAPARAAGRPRPGWRRGRPGRPGSSATGVAGAQAGGPERRADRVRIDPRGPCPSRRRHRAASGSDGRASRSSPARSPAANRRAPAAPIIAPLSVHSAGPRHDQRQPERLGLAREPRPQRAVRRHAAAHDDRPRAGRLGGPDRLGRRGRRRRRPGSPRRARRRRRRGAARRASSARPASARASVMIRRAAVLSPEKLRSYESPSHARGKTRSWRGRGLGRPPDRRPARVAEPEQPPDLVERLAGGVVERSCRAADRSGGRASRRGTCGRPTRRARRAGRPGPGGRRRSGRAARRRRRGPRGG